MLDNSVYKINYQTIMLFVYSFYNSVGPTFSSDNIQLQKYVNIQKIQMQENNFSQIYKVLTKTLQLTQVVRPS